MSPKDIEAAIKELPPFQGIVAANVRREYGSHYREKSGEETKDQNWQGIEKIFEPPIKARREVVFLGTAGERVITAGTLLARAAILAGMRVTQKNDYNITIMRGPSITEIILSPESITYTGVEQPDVVVALSDEGTKRGWDLFEKMKPGGRVILAVGVEIPATAGQILEVDFKAGGIKRKERALAALSMLAKSGDPVTEEMLQRALRDSMQGKRLEESLQVLEKAATLPVHTKTQST